MIKLILIAIIIEVVFHPRIDFGKNATLWYTWRKNRKYVLLW
jgi:hypothetical protein